MTIQNPNVRVEIANRIALGRYVIDREIVTGRVGSVVGNIVAIYQVSDGSIDKVWVIRG